MPRAPDKVLRVTWTIGTQSWSSGLPDRCYLAGSALECDLRIPAPGVSRRHAELDVSAGDATVTDLGSKNGTWVNGCRVESATLRPGDRLRLGPVEVRIDLATPDDAEIEILVGSAEHVERQTALDDSTTASHDDFMPAPALVFDRDMVQLASEPMLRVYLQAATSSQDDEPVLVTGETGAGKDCLVRLIHASSSRAGQPFVAFNVSTLNDGLVDAELFGVAEGAATDTRSRPGLFGEADGGTLFLDEIGEMKPGFQAKLLRAIETGVVRPVGGSEQKVDVRVVVATSRDPAALVESGRFRRDLYERLAVHEIHVPALRDRPQDIAPLMRHFLVQAAGQGRAVPLGVSTRAMNFLRSCAWEGNVRQLRNVALRLTSHPSAAGALVDEHAARVAYSRGTSETPLAASAEESLQSKRAEVERQEIGRVLAEVGWNRVRAAEKLGIARGTLRSKMRLYGIEPPSRPAGE